jgi:hypothetical protein
MVSFINQIRERRGSQLRRNPKAREAHVKILYCHQCGAEIDLAQDLWADPLFVEDKTFEEDQKIGRTIVLFDEL